VLVGFKSLGLFLNIFFKGLLAFFFFLKCDMLFASLNFNHYNGGRKIKTTTLLGKNILNFKLFQPKNTLPTPS
jgi:hypothetical protein